MCLSRRSSITVTVTLAPVYVLLNGATSKPSLQYHSRPVTFYFAFKLCQELLHVNKTAQLQPREARASYNLLQNYSPGNK